MRILFLTTYFRPESATNAILMTLLAEELAAHGHQITIVTGMPHYDNNRVEDAYRGKLWMKERTGDLNVRRVYLYVPKEKTRILGRLLNYISFNVTSGLAVLLTPRHDVLFVPSPPLTNGLTAWVVSRLKRMPFVYNVQDIYPDVAVRLGVLKNPRLIRLFSRMENFVYRKASAVSVISDCFQRNLAAKHVPEHKLKVIPNFVDTAFVSPRPRHNAFSHEHDLDASFVVLFAGNVGLSQGLETVLEAARQLAVLPKIKFVIVGNGASKAKLIQQAEAMQLSNVLFLPLQTYERVPEVYSAADICLIPLRRGLTQDSVPSKLWTIMGVARPVVATVDPSSDTYKVIQQAGCGLCADAEDAEGMAQAILQIYEDCDLAEQMGKRGRGFVEQNYTRQRVAEQYEDLFAELLANKSR
jgi:colanic acid biosynthesis glycosyl transferase WcaI